MNKWQYKNSSGTWTDYPTTADNASITGTTLVVKPTHAIWVGETATLRITTSDNSIGDTTSIYKVTDGATGGQGNPGQNASIVFLSNENMTFRKYRMVRLPLPPKSAMWWPIPAQRR